MPGRIDTMPVLAARSQQIDAVLYNLWRRAKLHLAMPLRIDMPQLKQMVFIVEQDRWIVVNARQFDLPILAWVKFQDSGRSSLHTPVTCTVNYYHFMASQLRDKALHIMADELEKRLK